MNDWLMQINQFLTYSDQKILTTAGTISHELAKTKANEEYDKFKGKQDQDDVSQFDEGLDQYLKGEP